jgi:hypothetical protein
MGVLDIFRSFHQGANGQPQQQPVTPDPKLNTAIPGSEAKSDGSIPAIPKAGEGAKSPLENYGKLWDKADTDKAPPTGAVTLKADPAKIAEAARKVDFKPAINAEALTKAVAGDAAALADVLNQAAQAGYAQATSATAKIVQDALTQQAKTFREEIIPDIVRRSTITNSLGADNPIFENPAVKPLVTMVENQMQMKFPNASAAEITTKAKEYLMETSTEFLKSSGMTVAAAQKDTKTSGGKQATDWGDYFGVTGE